MAEFEVRTEGRTYLSIVRRGVLREVAKYVPERAGKVFIVTTDEVWRLHGAALQSGLGSRTAVLKLPSGEVNKRLHNVETLADQMVQQGADRTSLVIGFGGGIVTERFWRRWMRQWAGKPASIWRRAKT
jgi:3-dehydroquinate synthase